MQRVVSPHAAYDIANSRRGDRNFLSLRTKTPSIPLREGSGDMHECFKRSVPRRRRIAKDLVLQAPAVLSWRPTSTLGDIESPRPRLSTIYAIADPWRVGQTK